MAFVAELKTSLMLLILAIKQFVDGIKIRLGLATESYGSCNTFNYKGVWFGEIAHSVERLKACERYDKFRPDDVVVATYNKAGTHFVAEVVMSIYKELRLIPKNRSYPDAVTSLEINRPPIMSRTAKGVDEGPMKGVEAPESPRILTTHLPWDLLPPMMKEGKVKVICCSRNPKDVLCSAFPFYKRLRVMSSSVSFDQYLDWFIEGNVAGGSYFNYMKKWYSYRNNCNVLNMQFKEMKKDLRRNVVRIVDFLNLKLTDEQIDAVVDSNTFEKKKKERGMNDPMYRRGKSGGWKSDITVEQNEMLDEWIQREMKGLEDLHLQYK